MILSQARLGSGGDHDFYQAHRASPRAHRRARDRSAARSAVAASADHRHAPARAGGRRAGSAADGYVRRLARGFPAMEPGRPWPDTFMAHFKKPPCAEPIWSPTTARELMDRTFAVMKRRNVYGVTSGSLTAQWKEASSRSNHSEPRIRAWRAERAVARSGSRRAHRAAAIAHLARSRTSIRASIRAIPRSTRISRSSEELDIPMSIHLGTGPPGCAVPRLPEISRAAAQPADDRRSA